MGIIYDLCVEAFDEAGWPHGGANDEETLGMSLVLHGRMIGGSLRVYDGTLVRILAWGAPDVPRERLGAFAALAANVNPKLLAGSLEIHASLGPVVRCSADLAGLIDWDQGEVVDRAGTRRLITDLATTATAVLDELWDVIAAVVAGMSPGAALDVLASDPASRLLR